MKNKKHCLGKEGSNQSQLRKTTPFSHPLGENSTVPLVDPWNIKVPALQLKACCGEGDEKGHRR
jgi:hypothetical protein